MDNRPLESVKVDFTTENGGFAVENEGFASENVGFTSENGGFAAAKGPFAKENGASAVENGAFASVNDSFAVENVTIAPENSLIAAENGHSSVGNGLMDKGFGRGMRAMSRFSILLIPVMLAGVFVGVAGGGPRYVNTGSVLADDKDVPTVALCDLMKRPSEFYDRKVRITGMFTQADEAQYLSDNGCPAKRDTDRIGVGFADADESGRERRSKEISKIGKPEYGGRAMVRVVGYLRNAQRHDFACYGMRFDIVRFEKIEPMVTDFAGELQAGNTYRATVQGDDMLGLVLVKALRIGEHHAVRLEWTNLSAFPELNKLRGMMSERKVVFSVLSDDIKQVTERRWNRTIRLRIISAE